MRSHPDATARTASAGRNTLPLWGVGAEPGRSDDGVDDHRSPGGRRAHRYVCPPDCGRPPTGLPVATNPRFVAPGGEFSVAYPAPGAAYLITTEPNGITAEWMAGDGGTMRLFSQPAEGRDSKQIAKALLQEAFPNATTAYELPNATVGYHLGYGEVADFQPLGSDQSDRLRIVVVVAVKNGLALIAAAAGPFREFTRVSGRDHRRRRTCRSLRTWANTSTASRGAEIRRAEATGADRARRPRRPRAAGSVAVGGPASP